MPRAGRPDSTDVSAVEAALSLRRLFDSSRLSTIPGRAGTLSLVALRRRQDPERLNSISIHDATSGHDGTTTQSSLRRSGQILARCRLPGGRYL